VVAIGGLRDTGQPGQAFRTYLSYLMSLAGRPAPRLGLVSTAQGDDPALLHRVQEWSAGSPARLRHLALFPMPNVADPEDFLLSQDLIFVGGGSVANMLAVWRVHGLDAVLRQAWQAGIVLSGVSAGAICWFSGGTTDSFGAELRPFTDGLGLLAGSYCPHYDSEPRRRPLFTSLIATGRLPAGLACDDGAAVHFADEALDEVVSDHPGARGYRVEPDGAARAEETPLPPRLLPGPDG
jgi:peptidase E